MQIHQNMSYRLYYDNVYVKVALLCTIFIGKERKKSVCKIYINLNGLLKLIWCKSTISVIKDQIIIVAETADDCLTMFIQSYCEIWKLTLNTTKTTKVLVLTNGRRMTYHFKYGNDYILFSKNIFDCKCTLSLEYYISL